MYTQPLRKLPLRYTLGYTNCNQKMTEAAQVVELLKLTTLQALVALDFFLELKIEGFDRIGNALDFLVAEAGLLRADTMSSQACLLLRQTTHRLFYILSRSESLIASVSELHDTAWFSIAAGLAKCSREFKLVTIFISNSGTHAGKMRIEFDAIPMPHRKLLFGIAAIGLP